MTIAFRPLFVLALLVGFVACRQSPTVVDSATTVAAPVQTAGPGTATVQHAPETLAEATSLPAAVTPLATADIAAATALPATTVVDVSALTGKIAYSYEMDVFVMNADGSGVTRLTTDPEWDFDPSWSPDGAQLAFVSDRNGWPTLPEYQPPGYDPANYGDMELFVMDVDGSSQLNLTNNPRQDHDFPAWSRDGRIVFSRYGCLMIVNRDGTGLIQLSKGNCAGTDSGGFPDWFQRPP